MTVGYYIKLPFYRVSRNGSCVENITVDTDFVWDKATVLGDNIKGALFNVFYQLQINAYKAKKQ